MESDSPVRDQVWLELTAHYSQRLKMRESFVYPTLGYAIPAAITGVVFRDSGLHVRLPLKFRVCDWNGRHGGLKNHC